MNAYWFSILGLLVLSALPVVLAGIVGPVRGFAGVLPGVMRKPDYRDPVYRLDRAHMNAVENLATFTVPAVLAMVVGVLPIHLAVLVWLQVILRVTFTLVYAFAIGPVAGGPRTGLFVVGTINSFLLYALTAYVALVGGAA